MLNVMVKTSGELDQVSLLSGQESEVHTGSPNLDNKDRKAWSDGSTPAAPVRRSDQNLA